MKLEGDKRKMKKQTILILVAITVITCLITVSALSNEVGYRVSPCDAVDISLENVTVTDFLNATNMTTVQVYNFKGYKGENCWMVQWSSSNRLLSVYVNVATGNIVGIEKQAGPLPISKTKRWHPVVSFSGTEEKITRPFIIRGDKWRVHYLSSATYTTRSIAEENGISCARLFVSIFLEDEAEESISVFYSSDIDCNRTQYIYRGEGKGSDTYYFNVTKASNLDWWQFLVEDYY